MTDIQRFQYDKKPGWLTRKIGGLKARLHKLDFWYHTNFKKPLKLDHKKIIPDSIPIFLNNFNRLETLKAMIEWLQQLEGSKSIIVVDNDSTYPPLLEFYKSIDEPNMQVIMLEFNSARKGVAKLSGMLQGFDKFIISDTDLLPYPDTPNDLLLHLSKLLDKYQQYNHIGCSLEIEDIPDGYPLKKMVQSWEAQFWKKENIRNNEVYIAPVDTTFAMYRKTSTVLEFYRSLRLMRPYRLKHMDWYVEPNRFSEEFRFYLKTSKNNATWTVELKDKLGI